MTIILILTTCLETCYKMNDVINFKKENYITYVVFPLFGKGIHQNLNTLIIGMWDCMKFVLSPL